EIFPDVERVWVAVVKQVIQYRGGVAGAAPSVVAKRHPKSGMLGAERAVPKDFDAGNTLRPAVRVDRFRGDGHHFALNAVHQIAADLIALGRQAGHEEDLRAFDGVGGEDYEACGHFTILPGLRRLPVLEEDLRDESGLGVNLFE